MAKQSRLVAIEGNTGCGKTEIIQWLSTFPDVEIREVSIISTTLLWKKRLLGISYFINSIHGILLYYIDFLNY